MTDQLAKIAKAMEPRELTRKPRKGPYDGAIYQTTHNTGGAIMGADPKTSAVNRYLQSWDVPNVFVTGGASAFPQNAGYNPTGTVGALAYWAADAITQPLSQKPRPAGVGANDAPLSHCRRSVCQPDGRGICARHPEFRPHRARTLSCGARRLCVMSYRAGRSAVRRRRGAADAVWHAGRAEHHVRIPTLASAAWSDDEFLATLHEGRRQNGKRLYPAFPYPAYTKMTGDDVMAMRAYFATVAPVNNRVVSNQLPVPAEHSVCDGVLERAQFYPRPLSNRSAKIRRDSTRRIFADRFDSGRG